LNSKPRSLSLVIAVGIVVLLFDRLTKLWVVNNIDLYGAWAPFPALDAYFRIIHTTNTGVAFGMFRGGGGIFALIAAFAAAAILFYSYRLPVSTPIWHYLALGLMLGGAGGNLWDRLVYDGQVIDFLHFHLNDAAAFPAFNLADSALVVGVILLVLMLWIDERRDNQATRADAPDLGADAGA
jgi:signal peptidase II